MLSNYFVANVNVDKTSKWSSPGHQSHPNTKAFYLKDIVFIMNPNFNFPNLPICKNSICQISNQNQACWKQRNTGLHMQI